MPLTSIPNPPSEALEGFWFGMDDGPSRVRILVTRDTLEDIESPPAANQARFDTYRWRFEEIAREKYDRRQLEPDGTIHI